VVEALACGVPVLGFRTGALPELVGSDGGVLADYVGGAPERLEPPDTRRLDAALEELSSALPSLRRSARARALGHFTSARMFDAYADVILGLTGARS
jgi:glycosyltransferase involved in cell wall biosynthesis